MLQELSNLVVADNTGAKRAMCFRILKQRNWMCDTTDARRDFNFQPKYSLREGIREAIAWYREAGWL